MHNHSKREELAAFLQEETGDIDRFVENSFGIFSCVSHGVSACPATHDHRAPWRDIMETGQAFQSRPSLLGEWGSKRAASMKGLAHGFSFAPHCRVRAGVYVCHNGHGRFVTERPRRLEAGH